MIATAAAKPSGRSARRGCLCLLIVVLSAFAAWVWLDSLRGWSVGRLENLIRTEIGADADRRAVEAWFVRHGISHTYFADTTGDRAASQTMPMIAGFRDEDLSGMVRGVIEGPEANVGFLDSGRISVYFFFDKQGRLVGHLVKPFVYSL